MNVKFEVENHLECLEYAPKIWNFFIMVPSSEVVCSSKSQWSEESNRVLLSMTIFLLFCFGEKWEVPLFVSFLLHLWLLYKDDKGILLLLIVKARGGVSSSWHYFFSFHFYDAAKFVMIHKSINPNLALNMRIK
jgi:hypothetical protein